MIGVLRRLRRPVIVSVPVDRRRSSSQLSSRTCPVPPAARVGEQFGDLGSLCPLANCGARREGAGRRIEIFTLPQLRQKA